MPESDLLPEYIRTWATVFYQRRWVKLPVFFIPKTAYDPQTGRLSIFRVEVLEGGPLSELETRDCAQAWKSKDDQVEACLLPWNMDQKEIKQLCEKFGIPFSWVTGASQQAAKKRSGSLCRFENESRKNKPLSDKEYRVFRKEIKKISLEAMVVCDILREVNTAFNPGGSYITLEEVARLQPSHVGPFSDSKNNWVTFSRSFNAQILTTYVSNRLWKALCKLIRDDSVFVFSNSHGAPLSPVQLNEYIRTAAKNAGINRDVSSLSFRPPVDNDALKASSTSYLYPVAEEDWNRMREAIPQLRETRGRPPSHNQLSILNAILGSMCDSRPAVSLGSSPILREVVKSQRKRWEKNGVLKAILDFLKLQKTR